MPNDSASGSPRALSIPHAEALESLLHDLTVAHERLWRSSSGLREAIRSADPSGVERATADQSASLGAIADLEERRRALVGEITSIGACPAGFAGRPVTLTDLASMAPEPCRARLMEAAECLRRCVAQAAEAQRTLRSASSSLLAHMEGLMRQVAQRLSHAGTYGRRGVIEGSPAVVSGLDLVT
ncbi:MAG: flagellar export chaperone FlgN [Phycisphaeraceae bacterium]|nr:flagellar export chaperone FlgN [Phycisphaerae bacterium]MBX3393045.1 flagellar export chaperone FlgN [Phycisphaeraceae bacterium]HRJ50481.1 flagellar protein FlgN [Phycisphaerales bacterium]